MERFIVKRTLKDWFNTEFKIQYGEIYRLLRSFISSSKIYLKSSMERFIDF